MRMVYRVHPDALPPAPAKVVDAFITKGSSIEVMKKFVRDVGAEPKWKGYGIVGHILQGVDADTRGYNLALMIWSWVTADLLSPPALPNFSHEDTARWMSDWPSEPPSVMDLQRKALTEACGMPKREGWAVALTASALVSPRGLNGFHIGLKTLITASTLETERRVQT